MIAATLVWMLVASNSDIAGLPRALSTAFRADLAQEFADLDQCLSERQQPYQSALRVSRVQLSSTSGPTILIEGLGPCLAGANNGPHWVYLKTPDGWHQILSSSGFRFVPLSLCHNAFADVAVWGHSSAYESIRTVYAFTAGRYRPSSCQVVTHGGTEGWFKQPVYRPCTFDWRHD